MDFSAALPMSPLSADNPTYDNTVDAMEQKSVPLVIKEGDLSQDTKTTPVASNPDANVIAASGSETQDALPQEEDGGVLSSCENIKLPQEEKGEGLPSNENEVPIDKENEGLPGQKHGVLQKEEDGEIPGQKDHDQEHVDEDRKENKNGVLQ